MSKLFNRKWKKITKKNRKYIHIHINTQKSLQCTLKLFIPQTIHTIIFVVIVVESQFVALHFDTTHMQLVVA